MALENVGTFILTDSSLDRHSERVIVEGVDYSAFEKNSPMFYNHHRSEDAWWGDADATKILPVGTWKNVRRENGAIVADAYVNTSSDFGNQLAESVKMGVIKAVSIGFVATAYSDADEDKVEGQKGVTILKSELREASLVDIPSNPNALAISVGDEIKKKSVTSEDGKGIDLENKVFFKICTKEETPTKMEKIDLNPPKEVQPKQEKKEPKLKSVETIQTKGDALGSLLSNAVDDLVTDDLSRSEIVEDLAEEAGIEASTINQILSGEINCPPFESRVLPIGSHLGISQSALESAYMDDGCEIPEENRAKKSFIERMADKVLGRKKEKSISLNKEEMKKEEIQKMIEANNESISKTIGASIETALSGITETIGKVVDNNNNMVDAIQEIQAGLSGDAKNKMEKKLPLSFKVLGNSTKADPVADGNDPGNVDEDGEDVQMDSFSSYFRSPGGMSFGKFKMLNGKK